jgi:ATP phosphoribosyltransferase regulatory subunit
VARADRVAITPALDRFARRLDAFAASAIDVDRLAFATDFGRRLDYYTGFVFEMHRGRGSAGRPIVGGGRYDRLLAHIGAGGAVPAVGFAVWLDRVGAAP